MPATEDLRPGVLIVGVSTRALAVSAARVGYRVTAIDAFGDLDLRGAAETVALRPEHGMKYSPMAAARAAETVSENLVAYTSNLENHPAAVALLAGVVLTLAGAGVANAAAPAASASRPWLKLVSARCARAVARRMTPSRWTVPVPST